MARKYGAVRVGLAGANELVARWHCWHGRMPDCKLAIAAVLEAERRL